MADIKKIKIGDTTYDIKDATAARSNHTHNYAGSNSAGGPANSVKNALTFGSKTYNGSSAQTITLADLGGQAAGNYAILDSNGRLADSVIPAVAITDTYVVATETAMLALSAQKGDIAIRSDLNKSFVLQTKPASTLANWKELLTPTDAVLSVNGKTGAVTLNLDNINDGSTRKLADYVKKSLTSAKGDMIYASGANTPARLGIGSNGQFLSVANGIPKWVNNPNTDTKVTSVDNHYPPTADSGAELAATLSGTAGAYAKDKEYTVLTGVKAQRDTKGHVTGITYTAQKIKDTNTDTKNTAGATNDTGKLYLVGAKTQDANPQTYSYSQVYMTDGILAAPVLSTRNIVLPESYLGLKFVDGDNVVSAANFHYDALGGVDLNMIGHVVLSEAGDHPDKPENKTGLNYMSCADYFDTGIAVIGQRTSSDLPLIIKLSFPEHSGTLATLDDTKIEIVDLAGN